MKITSKILCSVMLLLVAGLCVPAPPSYAEDIQRIEIPFTLNGEQEMMVEANIAGHQARLIVDTGMDAPLLLSLPFCAKVGFLPDQVPASIHVFGEKSEQIVNTLPGFIMSINGVDFSIYRGLQIDKLDIFTDDPAGADGVMGWGFLKAFHVVIDYPSKLIVLSAPGEEVDGDGIRFNGESLPIVYGKIFNQNVPFLLDTASMQSWISYEYLEKETNLTGFSSGPGDFKGIYQVAALQVDQASLQNLSLNVMGDFVDHSRTESFKGILGSNALEGMTVELDASRGTASITPGPWRPASGALPAVGPMSAQVAH